MKTKYLLTLALLLVASFVGAQTPGLIYKPSSGIGPSVLDPNGDGYTSLSTSGFSGTDYGTNSELNMITMPGIVNEPSTDQDRGPAGGFTDLVNNGTNHSVYILTKNVGGTDYFIIRFRLGGASSATKGYSVAFDTDGVFGNYPTSYNPGFEKEVVLETGNNGRVVVYSHSSSGAAVSQTYAIDNYSQRSIALSTINGDADYFYDFFVPLSALGISGPVRMAASTVINATSALTGNLSDINGIDDQAFGNNANSIFEAMVSAQPTATLSNMTEGASFDPIKSFTPTVTGPLSTSSTTVTGTSLEADGATITVYVNGVSVGTTTVTSNAWTYTLGASLSAGDVVTATATATSKSISNTSTSVTATDASCYLARPVVVSRSNGGKTLEGTWPGTPAANTIRINIYQQTNGSLTFTDVTPATIFVTTGGTWASTAITGMGNGVVYYVTATNVNTGCVSLYSSPSTHNNNLSTVTASPSITTTSVLDSIGPRTITVQNLEAGTAFIQLYVNGVLKSTSAAIAQNATTNFQISGLNEGDTIVARAQASTGTKNLSAISNMLAVSGRGGQSASPTISGAYVAGSGQTVSGTSTEDPGTTIFIYQGSTLLGSTTVDLYGNWSLGGLTLTSGQVLTAYADASGKSLSTASTGVTIAASTPTTPTVTTSPLSVGLTSISGTSGAAVAGDSIQMYVDGALVATVVAGTNWTVNFASNELYNGAEVTFVRVNAQGVSSAATTPVSVIGVVSFSITQPGGTTALGNQVAGTPFNLRIRGMSAANGTGSVITTFTGTVVVYSTSKVLAGDVPSSAFVSGDLASHSLTLGTAGTGITIGCINSDDPSAVGTTTIDVTAAVFTGATNTSDAITGNWGNSQIPASGADIELNGTTANDLIMTGDLTFGNITNSSLHPLTTNGNTLTITGDISVSNGGQIDATNGTIEMAGTSAQTLDGTVFTSDTIQNLNINNEFGVSVSNTLAVSGVLNPSAGTLTTNGNLKLIATDSLNYAQIAVGSGSISGNIEYQMYINKGYHNVGSPVSTTVNDLNEGGLMNGATWDWNGSNSQWETCDTTGSFIPGTGIFVYFGYLGPGYTYCFVTPNVLRLTGTPNNGDYTKYLFFHDGTGTNATFATTDSSGWNLMANPYPSNLDWDNATIPSNTNSAIYIWDPANNRYTSYTKGAGTGTNGGTRYVAPAQGFYIETQDALGGDSVLFTYSNTLRTTSQAATFFKNGRPFEEFHLTMTDANGKTDETFLQFNDVATENYDGNYDARKFMNGAGMPNLYSLGTAQYSINCLPIFESNYSLPLGINCNTAQATSYTIALGETNKLEGWKLFIEDKYTKTWKEITNDVYTFTHQGTQPVEDRLILHMVKPQVDPNSVEEYQATGFRLSQDYSQVYFDLGEYTAQELNIRITDMSGKEIKTFTQQISGTKGQIDNLQNLPHGAYVIEVQCGQHESEIKIIR
ncbi:MAG: hypothetical protein EP332_03140 [Bacteroidetes bacterium]|nr:MAG: hypothetical protein EP332_03140 [Bacteroidota bacterium]